MPILTRRGGRMGIALALPILRVGAKRLVFHHFYSDLSAFHSVPNAA